MKKSFLLAAACGLVVTTSHAGLFDQLQKGLNKLQVNQGAATSSAAAQPQGNNRTVDQICRRVLGAPYEGKLPPGVEKEALIREYFKYSVDIDKRLREGIDVMHQGSMVNMRLLIQDLHDQKVRKLAEAFVGDPSQTNLAYIVALAKIGDGYQPEDGPSEQTEAATLLALTILQYPELANNTQDAVAILRSNFTKSSGLSTALLARFHLFGDYMQQDLGAFGNYLGQAGNKYQVHLNDQTVFFALKNIPNWNYAKQYTDLINMSREMSKSFQKSNGSIAASQGLRERTLSLMEAGQSIDDMTLEALGAGPTVAQLRARGERMKAEAGGQANLVEVAVSTSDDYRKEFEKLLRSSPKLSDDAKAKLAQAQKKRAENIGEMYGVTGQVAMLFFNGNFKDTVELGAQVNRYFRNSCDATFRAIQFAKESGVPEPTASIDMDKLMEE